MNIMVIDDDAGSLRGMTMGLGILGYQCKAFASPEAAAFLEKPQDAMELANVLGNVKREFLDRAVLTKYII